jgi:protein phosphatase
VVSSDACRAAICDDEADQTATPDAFALLHFTVERRLARRRLTVVDATNVQEEARRSLLALARQHHVAPVAIVLDLPENVCVERNRGRPRDVGPQVVAGHRRALRASLRGLREEGFRHVHILSTPGQVERVRVERRPLRCDRRADRGPFDVVGDVHGCRDELLALLAELGYAIEPGELPVARHPQGRRLVFLGDLVDRGPDTPGVLRLVMGSVRAGTALAVPGNHDVKLVRKLRGADVRLGHGLAESLAQLEREPPGFLPVVADFLDSLVCHYVLDGGALVVAHAGMKEQLQGRDSGEVRRFALWGDTTGEVDERGLPVRLDWAADYRGKALVVYGHTPVERAEWMNGTICLDTGCVFGGRLSALRYPERELAFVPATAVHYAPPRPEPRHTRPSRTAPG